MKIVIYSFAFVLLCISVHAQQTVTSATLSGRVEDEHGAVISGAVVTATNLETNQQFSATSDRQGHFKFPILRVGN